MMNTQTPMVSTTEPQANALPNAQALPSRRTLLRRLAAIGLIAGAPVLTPLMADAKGKGKGRKQRKQRTQEKAKAKHSRKDEQPEDSPTSNAAHAEVGVRALSIPDPGFFDKQHRPDGVFLTIGSRTANNRRRVTVEGSIAFFREHTALMKAGYKFRLRCEGWGMDSGCSLPSDKEFTLILPKKEEVYALSSGASSGTFSKPFKFYGDVASSDLNEDVDDGWWDTCDDDRDDIAAELIVDALPLGAKNWTPVTRYLTNEVQGYF